MPGRIGCLALVAMCFLGFVEPAPAYVDLAPTLATVIRDSQAIAVVEVDRFSLDKGIVILKKVRDLKGEVGAEPIKHRLVRANEASVERTILDWAEPGSRGVLFVSGKSAMVCMGRGWYQVAAADAYWQLGIARPDLPLAYHGNVSRLCAAIPLVLDGKTAIVTTLPHGAEQQAASFDLALNRASMPGLLPVQRVRANQRMPNVVIAVSANPTYLVGPGSAEDEEIPDLKKNLRAADALVRAESAADLGSLGARAASAADDLEKLLDDTSPVARMAGAAALLRVKPRAARAREVLAKGLESSEATTRRQAARAIGSTGPAAADLAGKLGALLADSDVRVRRAALLAIATLGPSAAGALDAVVKLLDTPETALDAAEALGRMGSAARPAVKPLTKMLKAEAVTERWAAVRAISQIGGEDAAPAVEFMIRELRNGVEVDCYNMMIYLALLGPVAKDAIPAIQSARLKNPILKPATIWAIEPDKRFPWLNAGGFGMPFGEADFARYIYESYVQELGDRLKPAASALAKKIMDGSAGDVPPWGYKLLAHFPVESLAILTPGLMDKELKVRQRVTVALGYMGPAAAAAKTKITEAIANAPNEKEQRLLKWSLREIEAAPAATDS